VISDAMSSPAAIHVVSPAEFDSGTAQTPGSERRAAIAPALGVASTIWGGLFEVTPGSQTGIHHHGEQETIAYVLSGICEIRWGAKGEYAARAGRRLHPCPRLSAAHGNQSFETGTVSMGRRTEHGDTHRRQSSGRHLAVSRMSSSGQQEDIWP
jgi:uncharacterized RmlC-like cupin family protein